MARRITPTSGLTCEAVKKLGGKNLAVGCCPDCHDVTHFLRQEHRLRWVSTNRFSMPAWPGAGYVCCLVERAIKRPWQHGVDNQPIAKVKLSGSGTAGNATFTVLADSLVEYKAAMTEQINTASPLVFASTSSNVAPPPNLGNCSDPFCDACGPSTKAFWSYKLQQWMSFEEYGAVAEIYGLHVEHPWAPDHVCAPGHWKHPLKDATQMPEYRAFMCRNAALLPTFGVKYCANPVWATILPKGPEGTSIIMRVPKQEELGAYVPDQFMKYVVKVIKI